MIMRSLSTNPSAANPPLAPPPMTPEQEETVRCHKRETLAHAQRLEFCLKWTALQAAKSPSIWSQLLFFQPIFPPHVRAAALCVAGAMLGHHYPGTDKSQQLVNYVEDYLECVESLPLDIQRNVSLLREIDAKYQGIVLGPLFLCCGFDYRACLQPENVKRQMMMMMRMMMMGWNGGTGAGLLFPILHRNQQKKPERPLVHVHFDRPEVTGPGIVVVSRRAFQKQAVRQLA